MTIKETNCCTPLACTYKESDLVITIDGPAGAGKTTISKIMAERLGYRYIDTGALYRGVAYEATQAGIEVDDDAALESFCQGLAFDFKRTPEGLRLFSNGKDISEFIRTPEMSMLASAVSARKPVRKYLLDVQRNYGKNKRVVLEGRDTGTVIFPEADVKFFLMAAPEIRAKRRFEQMTGQHGQTLAEVEKEMQKRDNDDTTRDLAPLEPADDAILIDSSQLSIERVIETMLMYIQRITAPLTFI